MTIDQRRFPRKRASKALFLRVIAYWGRVVGATKGNEAARFPFPAERWGGVGGGGSGAKISSQ